MPPEVPPPVHHAPPHTHPVWSAQPAGQTGGVAEENPHLRITHLPGELKPGLQQGCLHRVDPLVPAEHHAVVCSDPAQWQTPVSQAIRNTSYWYEIENM